jgi:hypothetical protein
MSGIPQKRTPADRTSLRYTVAPSLAGPVSPVGRPRRAITISAMMLSSAVAIK